ncbi:MAG: glycosyltransferase 87 family protein [Bacillota bacterium]
MAGIEKAETTRARRDRWALVVAFVAVAATACKVWLALRTFGSNDVLYWERFLQGYRDLGGAGLYRQYGLFNHPPFMVHVLWVMGWLTDATGVWFPFWLRLPAILADLGSVVLVYRMMVGDSGQSAARWAAAKRWGTTKRGMAVVLMAGSPISVLVSGFHGNTDPVMIFFVLLSVYLVERRWPVWVAGVAMGMGMCIKVVPVIFMPAIFLYLPDMRRRVEYFGTVGATFVAASMPVIMQDPVIVAVKVFGYGSIYGHWGLSRLASWLPGSWDWVNVGLERYGRYGAVGMVVAAAFWMNRRTEKPRLFVQCGVVMFVFMSLSVGFGIQYLAWLVPWVVELGVAACVLCYGTSGVFQFLVYNYWSRGMWYFADSDTVRDWKGFIIGFEVACWVGVVGVLMMYLMQLGQRHEGMEARRHKGEE